MLDLLWPLVFEQLKIVLIQTDHGTVEVIRDSDRNRYEFHIGPDHTRSARQMRAVAQLVGRTAWRDVNVIDRSLAKAQCGKDEKAKRFENDRAKERATQTEHALHLPNPNSSAIWLLRALQVVVGRIP